jgi:hypothetical protein
MLQNGYLCQYVFCIIIYSQAYTIEISFGRGRGFEWYFGFELGGVADGGLFCLRSYLTRQQDGHSLNIEDLLADMQWLFDLLDSVKDELGGGDITLGGGLSIWQPCLACRTQSFVLLLDLSQIDLNRGGNTATSPALGTTYKCSKPRTCVLIRVAPTGQDPIFNIRMLQSVSP